MKHMALVITALAIDWAVRSATLAREAKEYDADVNYDEAKIPHCDLPPLLLTPER